MYLFELVDIMNLKVKNKQEKDKNDNLIIKNFEDLSKYVKVKSTLNLTKRMSLKACGELR